MQKYNRSARYGRKYPKHPVIKLNDTQESEAWYDATISDASLGPGHFAAGVIQHPVTQLYQTWLSTNGLDVACLSAHRDSARAVADLQEIKTLISSSDFYDDEKIMALFEKVHQGSDEEPSALPDALVHEITRTILRAVVERPSQQKG